VACLEVARSDKPKAHAINKLRFGTIELAPKRCDCVEQLTPRCGALNAAAHAAARRGGPLSAAQHGKGLSPKQARTRMCLEGERCERRLKKWMNGVQPPRF
jgi:hypothetical protein